MYWTSEKRVTGTFHNGELELVKRKLRCKRLGKLMLSALKSMALHGIKWHFSAKTFGAHCFSALTFDTSQNSRDHFGVSWRKRPFLLDFAVNFFTRVYRH